jgi:hypothetical protein
MSTRRRRHTPEQIVRKLAVPRGVVEVRASLSVLSAA